jgi:hypothetical protein
VDLRNEGKTSSIGGTAVQRINDAAPAIRREGLT